MVQFVKKTVFNQDKAVYRSLKKKRYRTIRSVSEEDCATIFQCVDILLNRLIFVKELKKEHHEDRSIMQSFIQEFRLLSYLDHPGIPTVFDLLLWGEKRLAYSMRYFEGHSLSTLLKHKQSSPFHPYFSYNKTLDIIKKVCEILSYVHDKGIVHLKIKPESIHIGKYGEVFIPTWKSAQFYDSTLFYEHGKKYCVARGKQKKKQQTNQFLYAMQGMRSKEAVKANSDFLTPSSDIFSTGIVFYNLILGTFLYPNQDIHIDDTQSFEHTKGIPRLDLVNNDIPAGLADMCEKMLEKDSLFRYHSFKEILDDLENLSHIGFERNKNLSHLNNPV